MMILRSAWMFPCMCCTSLPSPSLSHLDFSNSPRASNSASCLISFEFVLFTYNTIIVTGVVNILKFTLQLRLADPLLLTLFRMN